MARSWGFATKSSRRDDLKGESGSKIVLCGVANGACIIQAPSTMEPPRRVTATAGPRTHGQSFRWWNPQTVLQAKKTSIKQALLTLFRDPTKNIPPSK